MSQVHPEDEEVSQALPEDEKVSQALPEDQVVSQALPNDQEVSQVLPDDQDESCVPFEDIDDNHGQETIPQKCFFPKKDTGKLNLEGLPDLLDEENDQGMQEDAPGLHRGSTRVAQKYLFARQDPTSENLGRATICIDGDQMDPGRGLNIVEQMVAESTIQQTVITPFDSSEYCQALRNPLPELAYEIITVQRVHENIQMWEQSKQDSSRKHLYLACSDRNHKLQRGELNAESETFETLNSKQCDYCRKMEKIDRLYRCEICKFDVCINCQVQSFVRRKIESKTSRHGYYQSYFFDSNSANDTDLLQKEEDTRETQETTGVIAHDFAELKIDNKVNPAQQSQLPDHAIVGFWNKNKTGEFECYRQFQVDRPLFFQKQIDACKIQTLLHKDEKGQLFYFQQTECDSEPVVSLVKIDLEKAVNTEKADLEVYCRNVLLLPTNGDPYIFGEQVQNFMSLFFGIKRGYIMNENSLPQLFGNTLCFTSQFSIDQFLTGQRPDQKVKKSQDKNLVFINLEEPSTFQKILTNARVLIEIKADEDGNIESVWCSNRQSIMHISWDQIYSPINGQVIPKTYDCIQSYQFTSIGIDQLEQYTEEPRKQKMLKLQENQFHNVLAENWRENSGIEAKIHGQDTRCTFIFGGHDYYVFQLEGPETLLEKDSGQAKLILEHFQVPDARFVSVDQSSKNYILCNLHQDEHDAEIQEVQGYCRYSLDLIDLDQDVESQQPFFNTYNNNYTVIQAQQFHVLMFNNMKQYGSAIQTKLAPYQFSDFHIYMDEDYLKFRSQIFYIDHNQQRQNLAFIKGSITKHEKSRDYLPQNPPTDKFQMSYPIMLQNTHLPMQNQLFASTFAQNVPQIKIDLGEFRFICFVETGLQMPFVEQNHNQIFFLVSPPDRNSIRLMTYRTFAWPIHEHNQQLKCKKDALRIVSGEIDFFRKQNSLTVDKIISSCILHRQVPDKGILMKLVVQFFNKIVVFSLNSQDEYTELCLDWRHNMVRQPMICAPNNQAYYAQVVDQKSCLMAISQKVSEIIETQVYTQSASILQIQLAKDQMFDSKAMHSIYILSNNNTLVELLCNSGLETSIENQVFEVLRSIKLYGMENLLNRLQNSDWQQIVLSSRSITCQKEDLSSEDIDHWDPQTAITYNIASQMRTVHSYLGYQSDIKQFKIYKKQISKLEREAPIDINCQYRSIQQVENVGKMISVVQEGKKTYYKLQQSLDNRRIDLLDYDQQSEMNSSLYFIGGHIACQLPGQFLFFSQHDLMLKHVEPILDINPCTNVYGSDRMAYFKIHFRSYDGDVKKQIMRLDDEGYLNTVREQSGLQYFKKFKANLKKSLKTVDYVIPNTSPEPALTNRGTYVQTYLTYKVDQSSETEDKQKQKKDESIYVYLISQAPEQIKLNESFLLSSMPFDSQNRTIQEEDQIYIFRNNDWTPSMFNQAKITITSDFLVLKIQQYIYFGRLSQIYEINKASEQKFNTSFESNFESLYTKIQLNLCKIEMQKIDIEDFFNDRILASDFAVLTLSHEAVKICDIYQNRENIVQIVTREITLVWDLQENKEIAFYTAPSQLNRPETFVRLGIDINVPDPTKQTLQNDRGILANTDQSMFIRPIQGKESSQLFRTFTPLDLFEMRGLFDYIDKRYSPDQVDKETILCNIYGRNFFDIFQDHPELFNIIGDQLDLDSFPNFVDENQIVYDHIFIRRLYFTLSMPVPLSSENQSSFLQQRHHHHRNIMVGRGNATLIQKALHNQDIKSRLVMESLLDFILRSNEASLSNLITKFPDFKRIFRVKSQQIKEFLDQAFLENEMTRAVHSLQWDSRKKILAFGTPTSQLSMERILEKIEEKFHQTEKRKSSLRQICGRAVTWMKGDLGNPNVFVQVKVRILEIAWLQDNLYELFRFMANINDEPVFDLEIIKVLLQEQNYNRRIIATVMLPQLVYGFANCYHLSNYIRPETRVTDQYLEPGFGLRVIVWLGIAHTLFMESLQAYKMGLPYIFDFYNWLFLTVVALTATIQLEINFDWFNFSEKQMTDMAAITVLLQWLSFYYWMRLFAQFSHYINLIRQTLKDIFFFLILFFMCIAMFSNAIYVLDILPQTKAIAPIVTTMTSSNSTDFTIADCAPDTSGQLVQSLYDYRFLDTFINQYMLALGEFTLDPFEFHPNSKIVWIFFLFSTFLTQITFLNMMIAIMGDTFSKVMQNKNRFALIEKTQIYADYIPMIKLNDKFKGQKYMYIITPIGQEGDADWDGGVSAITQSLEKHALSQSHEMKQKMDLVRSSVTGIERALQRLHVENAELRGRLQSQQEKNKIERKKDMNEIKMLLKVLIGKEGNILEE